MKDIRSLLLGLLSVGLVATWIYHIYDKASYSRVQPSVSDVDSAAIILHVRDSLQKAYAQTIRQLDVQLDSTRNTTDSLQQQLAQKINEINRLRNEITSILKSPNTKPSQMKEARRKMAELEERIDELRSDNSSMEAEKLSMTARLDQMSAEVTNLEQNIKKLDTENKELKEKIRQASVFMASAVHLAAIDVKDDKEQETLQSKKADKFVSSFILQNNMNPYPNAEVFVVITEPDGQILQSSAWDSGIFETANGERKTYTRRVKFDYEKGEQKRLIFSLDTDTFKKGKYTLQVWHQGKMIGEASKVLN